MTDDIDPLSATFHEHGEDALGVAMDIVATMLQVRDAVLTSSHRARDVPRLRVGRT